MMNAIDAMRAVEDRAHELVVSTQMEGTERLHVSVTDSGSARSRKTCTGSAPDVSDDVDASHHTVILVLEIVAMKQVATTVSRPPHDNLNFFTVLYRHGILPTGLLTERRAAIPSDHLERHQVCVYGMQHRITEKRAIHEAPYLDISEAGIGIDTRRVEGLAIDHPAHAGWNTECGFSAEHERACPRRP